jgi:hypothetical protein
MLRFIAIALAQPIGTIIGSITIVSIAPKSEAMTANIQKTAVMTQLMSERSKLPER